MILNVLSVLMLFLAVVSILLAIGMGMGSLLILLQRRSDGEAHALTERRVALLFIVAVALLIVRLVSWPMFYGTLQSFVKYVPGAMCIYGVTQVQPHLSFGIQLLKPLVFFLIGGWLILHTLDTQTDTSPWMRRKLWLLVLISAFILGDAFADGVYFTHASRGTQVSRCTTTFDVVDRPTALIAGSLLGSHTGTPLWLSYYGLQIFLISWLGWLRVKRERVGRPVLLLLSLIALLNVVVSGLALVEVITPRLLGLPHHHDPYDLLGSLPDAFPLFGAFIVGTFAIGWAFWLTLMKPHEETAPLLPTYQRRLLETALIGFSISLVMVTIHVIVSRW